MTFSSIIANPDGPHYKLVDGDADVDVHNFQAFDSIASFLSGVDSDQSFALVLEGTDQLWYRDASSDDPVPSISYPDVVASADARVWQRENVTIPAGYITSAMLADSAITAAMIPAGVVTTAMIADGTLLLTDFAAGTADRFIARDGAGDVVEIDGGAAADLLRVATESDVGVVRLATDGEAAALTAGVAVQPSNMTSLVGALSLSGEENTISSEGSGYDLVLAKTGEDLRLRSISTPFAGTQVVDNGASEAMVLSTLPLLSELTAIGITPSGPPINAYLDDSGGSTVITIWDAVGSAYVEIDTAGFTPVAGTTLTLQSTTTADDTSTSVAIPAGTEYIKLAAIGSGGAGYDYGFDDRANGEDGGRGVAWFPTDGSVVINGYTLEPGETLHLDGEGSVRVSLGSTSSLGNLISATSGTSSVAGVAVIAGGSITTPTGGDASNFVDDTLHGDGGDYSGSPAAEPGIVGVEFYEFV